MNGKVAPARPWQIKEKKDADGEWVDALMTGAFGGERVISISGLHRPRELPGFVAARGQERLGLATFRIVGKSCELVSLNSVAEGQGIGTALLEAVKQVARASGCRELWLITTNDNLNSLRFYQRRGLVLRACHANIVEEWRKTKPEIPQTGNDGIPLRDALELVFRLE